MIEMERRLTGFRKVRTGGEATVYRALLDGQTPVAFKWYLEERKVDPEKVELYISHAFEGTSRLYGAGEWQGKPYFVSEYIRGTSSAELVPIPPKRAIRMIRTLCATLSTMSEAGVLHGDLGPDNVMVDADGNPVLIDFGIQGLGTPKFSAPERFEGSAPTVKSEIFSLGALLYYWIAGEPLFAGDTFSSIEQAIFHVDSYDASMLLYGRGKLAAEELRAFQNLWHGMLRRNPNQRFEDFEEFDECLEIAENELSQNYFAGEREKEALWKDGIRLSIREREAEIDRSPEEAFFFAPLKCEKTVTKSAETKNPAGKFLLGGAVFLFVTILLVFIFFFRTYSPDVENVGKLMLENSRAHQSGNDAESLQPDSVATVRGIMTEMESLSTDAQ